MVEGEAVAVAAEGLDSQDWEAIFEADGGLISLANHAQTPESLKKIGRLIISRLFSSNTPEETLRVDSETKNLDSLCDLNFDFEAKKGHFIKWLRNVKEYRISMQKLNDDAEPEAVESTANEEVETESVSSVGPNAADLPNVTASGTEDQEKALANTIEKAVREIIAEEIRAQFKVRLEKSFYIPEYSLPERHDGIRLPWPLVPNEFDKVLDIILPLVLQARGGELSGSIGNIVSEVTKQAKKKGLKGYSQTLPPKKSPERPKHLAARRAFLDNLKPEIRPALLEYVEGRENRQPLGMFAEGLRLLRKPESEKANNPNYEEKKDKIQNSDIYEQVVDKMKYMINFECNLSDFCFSDLSIVLLSIRNDRGENDFLRLTGKVDQWMEKIRDKMAKGEQPNAGDFENIYKEILNFTMDGRLIIPEVFALMLFFKVPDFNLRQLTSFRAFKVTGESRKPLINRFVRDYIVDFAEKTGLLINKFAAGQASVGECEILARSINDCFDIAAQPPTKQEKSKDTREVVSEESKSEHGMTANEKLVDSLKKACADSGEIGKITIEGLNELAKHYKARGRGEKFTARKDSLAGLMITNGANDLRRKILTFKAAFDQKFSTHPQKTTFDACFRDLYALTESSDTIKVMKDDPNHLTGPIARALESESFDIRTQFTDITHQFGALRKAAQETDFPPQVQIDNIVRDYQGYIFQKITGRQLNEKIVSEE
jgi:hypothetical protein